MLRETTFRRKKILFIVGSPNQTSQMHQVAAQLPEYDCFFSQLYSKNILIRHAVRRGILDNTILGGEFKRKSDAYLERHGLFNDYARSIYDNQYDMAILCSDLYVPGDLRQLKTLWVQEGMTDPITSWAKWTRRLRLPAYWAANTAFNGSSNICDIYCAASEGYRQQFIRLGTDAARIFVTGIPNYDHAAVHLNNAFPHRGYVLVATSDIRETFRKDDRPDFIRRCVGIAAGRQLIFKLHPNEDKERAVREVREIAPPGTLVFTEGNTEHMIANSDELITQYSTVVYIGIALGKKVHSYFDVEKLKQLAPVQNGGQSAALIADLCRRYVEFKGEKEEFLRAARVITNSLHERERTGYPRHYSNQEGVYPTAG
ncbi:MAG TPA: hypothetical protein VG101_10875 [Puia sp.]|jgi:hypothetical protein|nr:hypothetical protein [Puia sp.]